MSIISKGKPELLPYYAHLLSGSVTTELFPLHSSALLKAYIEIFSLCFFFLPLFPPLLFFHAPWLALSLYICLSLSLSLFYTS